MQVRWLGWAGAEIESGGATVVIDPLADARAVFAPIVKDEDAIRAPRVVPADAGKAVAGCVTHLHRDHADAAALAAALVPGAEVLEPQAGGGGPLEELALAQAEHELAASGLARRRMAAWESVDAGPFAITALPAADGVGDPQVAWLIEAAGVRVLHLGDTMQHGYWWRMALRHGPFDLVLVPVNGAVVSFPNRRPASPLPAALDPEQAALACELLGARLAIPIHHEGYEIDGIYEPVADAAQRFALETAQREVPAQILQPGETVTLQASETLSSAS